MQTATWYIRRLGRMGPGEIARRTRDAIRDVLDAAMLRARQKSIPLATLLPGLSDAAWRPAARVCNLPVGAWADARPGSIERNWLDRLTRRAEAIAAGRLPLFGCGETFLGQPIDWNRDHVLGVRAPMWFAPWIDYRDVRVAGDCKHVWEPSRHHQLVVLARAYRASGDRQFADAVAEQLSSWLDQCPFGCGMQWRSPLELGIRLINWVWAIDLVAESGAISGELFARLINAVYRQAWEIDRKYSAGSSSNNHLIGESAGVYVACCYFQGLRNGNEWRARSRQMFARAILDQTFDDGVSRELSTGYHLFTLQFAMAAILAGRWVGEEFDSPVRDRVRRMAEFPAAMAEPGGSVPMLNDCDDGYVLDLADGGRDVREWLAVAAAVCGKSRSALVNVDDCQSVRWCEPPGATAGAHSSNQAQPADAADLPATMASESLSSRAFPDAGYYLLQCGIVGRGDEDTRISVLFDCGPLGLPPLAGHGHADALSFTLRAFGVDVLVDPGTYDYFTDRRWRDYFRSTAAHNTVVIDGQNQSQPNGLFMWGRPARARCLLWRPGPFGGQIVAEHDGFSRLADPVVHRRRIELDGRTRRVVIHDEFLTTGRHSAELCFQFAESCRLAPMAGNKFRIETAAVPVTLSLDDRLAPRVLIGSENPLAGWVSRSLHSKVAAPAVRASCQFTGITVVTCTIEVAR